MKRVLLALMLAWVALPAMAQAAVTMQFECRHDGAEQGDRSATLAGTWDMVMDVGGIPSFGQLSLALADGKLTGSLSLNAGVVVVRSLVSDSGAVTMVVASQEGDVRFDGMLNGDGKRMCGVVSYHGGQKLEMVAQKRPERVRPPAAS